MKILIKQRFQISTIALLKNYCLIGERPPLIKNEDLSIDNIVDEIFVFSGARFRLANKDHKNKVYFHTDNPNGEHLNFSVCKLNGADAFLTTDTKKLKKYYGNPFAQITISTYERKITLNGKNLTLKYYKHSKHRDVNWKFFSKTSSSKSVTINLETGNITTIEYVHGKGGNKTIRKNCFADVFRILSAILDFPTKNEGLYSYSPPFNPLPNNVWGKAKKTELRKQTDNEFNVDQIYSTLFQILGVNTSDIFGVTRKTLLYDALIKFFVKTKNIKVPNNYFNLLINWYPTMKFLKKNNNKLIAAILDRLNIKSKYTIKLLHEYPKINLFFLVRLCQLFGDNYLDYIVKINPLIFCDDEKNKTNMFGFEDSFEKHFILESIKNEQNIKIKNHREKTKVVKYLNDSTNLFIDRKVLYGDLEDHIKMLDQVRIFYPEREMKASNSEEFKEEHMELTKFTLLLKKGSSIQYEYNPDMLKDIEMVIKSESFDFYPVVLKTEEEYVEEGSHMHHCVATYIDREVSLIISIRLNSKNGPDRVTCEFDTQNARCIQARYFCNGTPPEMFRESIEILKSKIIHWRKNLTYINKKVIPLIINGKNAEEIMTSTQDKQIMDILNADNYAVGWVPLPF